MQIDKERDTLKITWQCGHISKFDFNWLWRRRFTADGQKERSKFFGGEHTLWGTEMKYSIPRIELQMVKIYIVLILTIFSNTIGYDMGTNSCLTYQM